MMIANNNPKSQNHNLGKGEQALNEVAEFARRFEQDYPTLAEAIKLFGITNAQYERTLQSIYEPRTITRGSTVEVNDGYLEGNK